MSHAVCSVSRVLPYSTGRYASCFRKVLPCLVESIAPVLSFLISRGSHRQIYALMFALTRLWSVVTPLPWPVGMSSSSTASLGIVGSYQQLLHVSSRADPRRVAPPQSDVTPAQLEELEAAERWTQQQAMLAELDEQQEQLQMIS